MLAVGIGIGFVLGFMLALIGVRQLIIGTLKLARDDHDGSTYMYVELDRPYYPRYKHVVMRVDNSQL